MDAHANFSVSAVATAPSPATSGTSLVVTSTEGARFPATPFNAVICPAGVLPTPANAEIVRVTNIATDTFTITRAQEGSSARTVVVGDLIYAAVTKKTLTDIENNVVLKQDQSELGADTASVSFTIPSGYKGFEIDYFTRTDRASATEDLLLMQANGDTTAGHYYTQRELCSATSIQGSEFLGSFAGYVGVTVAILGSAGLFAEGTIRCINYDQATNDIMAHCTGFAPSSLVSGGLDSFRFGWIWHPSARAAITSIVLKPAVGTVLLAGSRFYLRMLP